jgi:hypothetical protein
MRTIERQPKRQISDGGRLVPAHYRQQAVNVGEIFFSPEKRLRYIVGYTQQRISAFATR